MNAGIHDKKESEVRNMGLFTDGFKLLKKLINGNGFVFGVPGSNERIL